MRTLLIVACLAAFPGLAFAQGNRAGAWEWSIAAIYQDSASSGAEGGSNLKLDSEWGLGINFGYNFTNKLYLGADIEWIRPDFTATLVEDAVDPRTISIDHEMYQFNGRIKGVLTFLEGPLSPFVEAGIGWSYFDSNVADGPPVTGCWWHPWWGYICQNYYSTFSSTEFSYGGALGLRYVLRGGMTLRLSVNQYWIDVGNAGGDPTLNAARLEIGWAF
ncbi:MAG: outer membrane beta-barrel protein [Gammaproteobacteria bacterium]|jgi:opacity protein-like surface antigen|nr:outer membrane beta-barrel protein [Gammaproteobacteria bacterium]